VEDDAAGKAQQQPGQESGGEGDDDNENDNDDEDEDEEATEVRPSAWDWVWLKARTRPELLPSTGRFLWSYTQALSGVMLLRRFAVLCRCRQSNARMISLGLAARTHSWHCSRCIGEGRGRVAVQLGSRPAERCVPGPDRGAAGGRADRVAQRAQRPR